MNRVIYLHTNGSKKLKLQMMLWRKFTGETITLPIKEAVRQAIIAESLKKTKLRGADTTGVLHCEYSVTSQYFHAKGLYLCVGSPSAGQAPSKQPDRY